MKKQKPASTIPAKPLRWSAPKNGRHLGAKTVQLVRSGMVFAIAQHIRGDEWFWYATDINTHANPEPLDTCKARALEHVRQRPTLQPVGKRS